MPYQRDPNEQTNPKAATPTRRPDAGRRRLLKQLAATTALVAGGGARAAARVAARGETVRGCSRDEFVRGESTGVGEERARKGEGTAERQEPAGVATDLVFLSVGEFDCTVVSDGFFPYSNPAAVMFATAPREELATALQERGIELAEWETYVSPYPPLVVETGTRTVLIDTGAGEIAPTTGRLFDNLHTAGIAPSDVDVVFLTHGHPDHIGGTVDAAGRPAFPNARYVMSRRDWEFWTGDPDLSPLRVGEELKMLLRQYPMAKLQPLEGQVELIEGETELAPGVTAVPAPGHTPGHFAVEVASEGDRFLHLADTALHPLHVPHPDWLAALDYADDQTISMRRTLYERAADTDALVLGYHFPSPGLGRVQKTGRGWRWNPVTTGDG